MVAGWSNRSPDHVLADVAAAAVRRMHRRLPPRSGDLSRFLTQPEPKPLYGAGMVALDPRLQAHSRP